VSAPLDFVKRFAAELRRSGIRFAITSGMACVHYGLQQTTKDSDWIIAPEELDRFRELLGRFECEMPPWRVAYRPIFERLERLLHVERAIWQCVNRERYGVFQREWKAFYRRWQADAEWSWPTGEPFWMQHQRVCDAARHYALPVQPLDPARREQVYREGLRRAANLTGADATEQALASPPIEEILP
jgi:hypothetical protein